jgi:selenocysteine lyase/cysteine desulfurase
MAGSDRREPRRTVVGVVPQSWPTLVGHDTLVPCVDGRDVPYLNFDAAASTPALTPVAAAVAEFVPWYSSVHRGAGYKSRLATSRYEQARESALRFARRGDGDVAIICRNTTEAINHLAYRLPLAPDDVILTTVVEHHANLLPWQRRARLRFVECDLDGTFTAEAVIDAMDAGPTPRFVTITGASNVTGWIAPVEPVIAAAHERGIQVMVDGAQLSPHRPLPSAADFVVWSGHKMYAPFGAGILIGPRAAFAEGDPFLAGGGAVDLVDLDEVVWTEPPDREEAGSPNVIGAIALDAAIATFETLGWDAVVAHDRAMAVYLRRRLAAIDGVRLLGPPLSVETTPVAAFVVDGQHHALVAARLSAEYGIGVRHGCFCAHPYLLRLLGLTAKEVASYRDAVLHHDRRLIPGAVRASASLTTTEADIDRLADAVAIIAAGGPAPVDYEQDPATGDYWPVTDQTGWRRDERGHGAPCSRG